MLFRKTFSVLFAAGLLLAVPACRSAHDDHHGREEKEVEQTVPMNMVPQAATDAVMKECPGGKITGAELVAKKGRIFYSFDVKTAGTAYNVKISLDGKFVSKKVDDDDNEKNEKDEKPTTTETQ